MVEDSRKARMRLIIFLLTMTLGVLAFAHANSQSGFGAKVQRSTTELVSSATPSAGTYFDHVVTILMENEGVFDICRSSPPPCLSSGPAPYMAGLANSTTIAAQYVSLIDTSQPNYVALISGSMQGCNSSGCPSPITAPNLVDRFEAVGLTWKGYFENQTLPRGCDSSSPEPYTAIHNPFIVFQDVTNNTARCNKLVDANPASCGSVIDCALVNDLNNATAPAPNFMWLTPNDCNDMRGNSVCGTSSLIGPGDKYLSKLVPTILNSRTFTTTRSALFITFDEGNSFCPGPFPSGESCVYTSWSGPAAKTRFGSPHFYNHYSFTKTVETNWNLASFTSNDLNASPMAEFFKNQGPDFTISANPSSITTPVGSRANSTITLASINNFTGTITLTASSSPTGPSLTLTPRSIPLTARGTGTSTLTFSSATIGTYAVTVIGTNSTLAHNTTITYTVAAPDFLISANPSSMAIGQLSSVAGTPFMVNSTGDRTFFESSYLAQSLYAKGLIWLFYEDSRSTCEHQTGCLFYTSSTNGTKWVPPTKVPVHVTDSDFSAYTNGTSVFYVRYNETSFDSSCGRKIQFGLGSLNTSGSITWQPEQTIAVGASNRAYPDDEITVDSNGQVWIAYMIDNKTSCSGSGTQRPQVVHSVGTNYAMWTSSTGNPGNRTLTTAHSNNWHIALVSLGNGRIYASYWIRNSDLHGQLYNGTAWGSDEQISATTVKNDVNAWLFNSGTSIYAIYFDNSTETFNFASRSSLGTWTTSIVGMGESHTGATAFSPSYYSLPDSASYDVKDNLFALFYLNATAQRIDQWSGSGSKWTKTTGLLSTAAAPYPNSISSFIQSSPTLIGSIFYISGSASPFTINSASLSFKPASNTGNFTITITGTNGFTATVSITTSVSPSTGLTVSCTPASIPGGSGSSACSLVSSARGNYTVTVTGTSGTLSHPATVAVSVSSIPDFSIQASSPAPSNAGQSPTSTITVTPLGGFTGIVALTDTIPSGLSCGSIAPGNITGSGTATVSCTATMAGNYTLTLTGTSGSLVHTATAVFQYRNFTLSASPPNPVNAGSSSIMTITVTGVNHFAGVVSITDTVPSGLTCGTITPNSVTGSGTATVSCSASVAGNYTLIVTGTSGSLVHSSTALFQFRDFATSATTPAALEVNQSATSTITITALNRFNGTVNLSDSIPTGLACAAISPTSLGGSGTATVSCSASIAGNYTLTVTGSSGSLSHSAVVVMRFQDFSITASAPPAANADQSPTSTITVAPINGFAGTVTFSIFPSLGLACGSFAPTSITGSGSATVSCTATIAGNYTATINGSSAPLVHNATVIFQFRDFTISVATPAPVNSGISANSTITVTALNHFSGSVSLTDTLPSGLTCGSVAPSVLTGSGIAMVSCKSMMVGNYTMTVTGSSGTLTHSTTFNVRVVDFSLSANSTSITILSGATAGSLLTVTGLNGFGGTVNLIVLSSVGVSATLLPTSITGSGSSTLLVSASTPGNYSITLKATSGSLSHLIGIVAHVLDYSLSGNPANLSAPIGSSTSSTLTLTSLNGYSGNVNVTYTVQSDSSVSSGGGGAGGGRRGLIMAPPAILPIISINPHSFQLSPGTALQSTVSISLPSNLPSGNYLLTLTATDGTLSHQIVLTIAATDFSIIATPNSVTIRPGSNTTILLNLQSLNFFQGNVSLTVTSQPGGPTGTLSTSTIQLTFYSSVNLNLTIQVPANTALGNYTITVQATSGTVSHTLTIPARVSATGFATILARILNAQNAGQISASAILAMLAILVTVRIRSDRDGKPRRGRRRKIEYHTIRKSATSQSLPVSFGLPPVGRLKSRDEF